MSEPSISREVLEAFEEYCNISASDVGLLDFPFINLSGEYPLKQRAPSEPTLSTRKYVPIRPRLDLLPRPHITPDILEQASRQLKPLPNLIPNNEFSFTETAKSSPKLFDREPSTGPCVVFVVYKSKVFRVLVTPGKDRILNVMNTASSIISTLTNNTEHANGLKMYRTMAELTPLDMDQVVDDVLISTNSQSQPWCLKSHPIFATLAPNSGISDYGHHLTLFPELASVSDESYSNELLNSHSTHSLLDSASPRIQSVNLQSDTTLKSSTEPLNEKRHVCDTCKASFKRSMHLKRHVLLSHLEHKIYQCATCSAEFNRKDSYDRHVKNQSCFWNNSENSSKRSNQSHLCPLCGSVFNKKNLLDQHLKTHNGQF